MWTKSSRTTNAALFWNHLDTLAQGVADHGRWNSLSQLVLKIASPGVADIYQGTELWTLTLVDPDNRQPVDFALRRRLLDELTAAQPAANSAQPLPWLAELLDKRRDGRIKLYTTLRGLAARRHWPDLFAEGEYLPLETSGQHAERIVALARRSGPQVAIAVVPRWTVGLAGFGGPPPIGPAWGDTTVKIPAGMPAAPLINVFTGERIDCAEQSLLVSQLLSQFPVALFAP